MIEKKLEDGQALSDHAAYDMHFAVDGKEVEPKDATVTVTINYKKALTLQKDATKAEKKETDLKVFHIEESAKGDKAVDVTKSVKESAPCEIEKVEYETGSFSTFVVMGATKNATTDTIFTNGGSYGLEYILGNFNAFVAGDLTAPHIVGAIAVGGDVKHTSGGTSALNLGGDTQYVLYKQTTNNYVKGDGSIAGAGAGPIKSPFYRGVNSKGNVPGGLTVLRTDSYIDFAAAKSSINTQINGISGTKVTKTGALTLDTGGVYEIEDLDKISQINFVGDSTKQTIVKTNDTAVNSFPTVKLNGAGRPNYTYDKWWSSEGVNAVFLLGKATTVSLGNSDNAGQIAAPNAAVTKGGGNWDGCIIADTLHTGSELHMYPYKGGKFAPEIFTLSAEKTVDGKTPALGQKFNFTLEKWNGSSWKTIEEKVQNNGKTITFNTKETYGKSDVGKTYWYRISESQDPVAGYELDTTKYLVKVVISEETTGSTTTIKKDVTYYKGENIPDDSAGSNITAEKNEDSNSWGSNYSYNYNNKTYNGLSGLKLDGNAEYVIVKQASKFVLWTKTPVDEKTKAAIMKAASEADGKGNRITQFDEIISGEGKYLQWTANEGNPGDYFFDVTPVGECDKYVLFTGGKVSHFLYGSYVQDGEIVKELAFNNETVKRLATQGGFSFTKTLDGNEQPTEKFNFNAKVVAQPESSAAIDLTAQNDKGTIQFATADGAFDKAGTYIYEVSEAAATGYDIDNKKYYVEIKVVESGSTAADRTLKVESTKYYKQDAYDATAKAIKAGAESISGVTFHNKYSTTNIALSGSKNLTGSNLADGQFTFNLKEVDSQGNPLAQGVALTAKNDSQGNFSFDAITYERPGTYYYNITEKNGGTTDSGITYDDTPIMVIVTVEMTADGLKATADKTAEQITFTNSYKAGSAVAAFVGTKTLEGASQTAGQFTFELYEANEQGQIESGARPIQTTTNESNGTFAFKALDYTEAGTHYYAIKEQYGGQTRGQIQYDDTVYTVKVTVTDDKKGNLTTETAYSNGKTQAEFKNTYVEEEKGSLTVTKRLTTNGIEQSNTVQDTFYVALFNGTARVSEVKAINYDGAKDANRVTFDELPIGASYTVWETDKDGNRLAQNATYTGDNGEYIVADTAKEVTITTQTSAVIANDITEGYYYEGSLQINKEVLRGNAPYKVTDTFYAGVFTDKECTQVLKLDRDGDGVEENVVVPLQLNDSSTTSATIEGIPLDPETLTAELYVAETDRDGNPIAGNSAINFTVSVERDGAVTVTNETTAQVTITNTFADGELTVTKQITRNGEPTDEIAEDTFYVGLFDAGKNAVSAVKEVNYRGSNANSVTFTGLTAGDTYYVYETDSEGFPLNNGDSYVSPASAYTVSAGSGQQVRVQTETAATLTNDLSEGYYYDGSLEITKKVLLGKKDYNVVNTYYAGVFIDKDCTTLAKLDLDGDGTEENAIVSLNLNDESEVTVALSQVPLGTYYVAETDENGTPLNNSKTEFDISIKGTTAKITEENTTAKTVITNTYDKKMTPQKSSGTQKGSGTQTGDPFDPMMMILIMLTAAAAMTVILITRKRYGKR